MIHFPFSALIVLVLIFGQNLSLYQYSLPGNRMQLVNLFSVVAKKLNLKNGRPLRPIVVLLSTSKSAVICIAAGRQKEYSDVHR